jgi:hypothetical protein
VDALRLGFGPDAASLPAAGVAVARRQMGDRLLQLVDLVAGAGLIPFGAVLGARSAEA